MEKTDLNALAGVANLRVMALRKRSGIISPIDAECTAERHEDRSHAKRRNEENSANSTRAEV